jgi:patatin-like phospholipase/acyl hydrolase
MEALMKYLRLLFIIAILLPISHLTIACYAAFDDFSDRADDRNRTVTVLTIDGGGVRGVIPATFLTLLQAQLDYPLIKYFDVTSGTSTGGLIALGLNIPKDNDDDCSDPKYTPSSVLKMYEDNAKHIFSHKMKNSFSVHGLIRPMYGRENLYKFSESFYDGAIFSSSLTNTIIPTYDITNGCPRILNSYKAKTDQDENFKTTDVGLATSAAPTYFAPYQMTSLSGKVSTHIDGGVVRNNPDIPAMLAAYESLKGRKKVFCLSLGTGKYDMKDHLSSYSPNLGGWINPLIKILLNGPVQANEYDTKKFMQIHNQDYHRLQVTLDKDLTAMDDGSDEHLQKLKMSAMNYFIDHYELFENIAETLRKLKES